MEIIGIRSLTFKYPGSSVNALESIDLSVASGEFVLLCGSSGSGKSTLLRHLKAALSPKGERSGDVLYCGKPLEEISERTQAQQIGFVGQDPEAMIVTDKVRHELAFGLESLGENSSVIRRRTAEMAEFFGISHLYDRSVTELSGGQKQLLALASAMTLRPSLLILDEPTAQLDPIAAHEFISAVARVNRELGITVIVSEHRTEDVFPYADRLICLENGRLILDTDPRSVSPDSVSEQLRLILPVPSRIWLACKGTGECPLSVADGRKWLSSTVSEPLSITHEKQPSEGEPVAAAHGVSFRYERSSPDVLSHLDLEIRRGELIGILGSNGSGKSTLLKVLTGIRKPYCGSVKKNGNVLMMPQHPVSLFVCDTLYDDLREVCTDDKRISETAALCRLGGLLKRHPYDLSGGELQRAALAKLLLADPDILLLDEPTKGTDPLFKQRFALILKKLCEQGRAVVIVSHDVEFCAENCTRCSMLFGGELLGDAPAFEFFGNNCFYTTAASRMASSLIEGAVTAEDVITALGFTSHKHTDFPDDLPDVPPDLPVHQHGKKLSPLRKTVAGISLASTAVFALACAGVFSIFSDSREYLQYVFFGLSLVAFTCSFTRSSEPPAVSRKIRKASKRSVIASVLILTLIPVTVFVGASYLNTGKYLFVSLLVMLEASLPFYIIFEGRSPRARELVTVSVLTASAVAGRLAFYMLPQFKPVLAVVTISGAAFGAHTGFLIGSLSMLLSNFIFGQGPWTPWQMFSMGLVGFLSGILFSKGILPPKREIISVFGFFSAVFIYGGIVNPSTLFIMHNEINRSSLTAAYAAGFPLDVIHGAATLIFLYALAPSVLKKLERLRTKYDFFE